MPSHSHIRHVLAILLLLLFLPQFTGCILFIDQNINDIPRIRQAGYIGKRFTTLVPMPVVAAGFFKRINSPDYSATEAGYKVIDQLPAGTRLRITKAEYMNFAGFSDNVRTTAILESGRYAGTSVIIDDIVDGWRLTASRNVYHPSTDKTSPSDTKIPTGQPDFPWVVWLRPYRDQPLPWAAQLSPSGELTDPAINTLLLALHDPDWIVRYYATRALSDATSRREEAASALIAALTDTDADVIRRILASLIKLQPTTPATLNTLVEILTQHQFKNRHYLGEDDLDFTLSRLGKPAALAIAAAIPTLDHDLLRRLLKALHTIGPEARVALPAIIARARLEAGDPKIWDGSESLGETLEEIDNAAAVQLCLPLLDDPDPKVRALFARFCGNAWNHNNPAIPALLKLLHDPNVEVRQIAANALGYTKPSPAEYELMLAPLIEATHDPDSAVRANSVESLGNPGARWPPAAGEKAVKALEQSLKDSDPTVRTKTVESLNELKVAGTSKSPYARAAYEALKPALTDPDAHVRAAAVRTIAVFHFSPEPAREQSLPYLLTALTDPDPKVRLTALQSLEWTALYFKAQPQIQSLLQDPIPEIRTQASKLMVPPKTPPNQ